MMTHDHGAGGKDDGGHVHAGRGHDLSGQSFVATADDHECVHGLGADHLFGVHGHEVAQEHGGGIREAFVNGDGGKDHGERAGEHDSTLDAFDEFGHIAVAGIVVAVGVGDADDGPREGIVRVAHGLDEDFAVKEREGLVAVVGESLLQAFVHDACPLVGICLVSMVEYLLSPVPKCEVPGAPAILRLRPAWRGRRRSAPWFRCWRDRGRARERRCGLHSRSRLQASPARRRLQEQDRSSRAE